MILQNSIGWCDATANPVIGCLGCELGKRCYALNDTPARVLRAGAWPGYKGQTVETFGPGSVRVPVAGFAAKLRGWNKLCVCDRCHNVAPFDRLGQSCGFIPQVGNFIDRTLVDNECSGTLRRIRVFADSNSDWMDWPIDVLASALDAIRLAPNLDIILCTKWPENFSDRLHFAMRVIHNETDQWISAWLDGDAPKNIILLTSITTLKSGKRIEDLLRIPARVHGLSCEPMWEDVSELLQNHWAKLGWVIVGGESGPGRRDCGAEAIRLVAKQCLSSRIPVYVKQDCALKAGQQGRIPDDIWRLKEFYQPL